ncbi:MAG: hypothetical protein P1U69_07440 [Parvibaculaceae bacterium]|nr:hypothetical protein [Parvibaculaceae bacterium]
MSNFQRDRYRKKLNNVLAKADDEAFIQMAWAIDALQSDRVEVAARFIDFPQEAAESEIASPYSVHKWELETLVCRLLVVGKDTLRDGRYRITDCSKFTAGATAANHLRNMENAESRIFLKRVDVLREMPRIAHRQFPWQRGYSNVSRFYRYAYLYGLGVCGEFFRHTHGLTLNDFSLVGFALHAAFQKSPNISRDYSLEEIGITPDTMEAALTLLSTPITNARAEAAKLVRAANKNTATPLPTAYQPSFLRHSPILAFGANNERLRAPLPDLIHQRITSGVYYDLIKGGTHLRNEAADRFEQYSADYIAAMMPRFSVGRSENYGSRKRPIFTPDVLVKDNDEIVVVVECKATKLTFGAQFAEDPMAEAESAYHEIANGVFQIWRYFSHARRGIAGPDVVRPDAHGMVLTLDTWLVMSGGYQNQLLAEATTLAARDPEITAEDRRKVVFCAIEDLETTLTNSDEDSFLRAMSSATNEDRFAGYILPDIYRENEEDEIEAKPFPFELGDVLPWWQTSENMRIHQGD